MSSRSSSTPRRLPTPPAHPRTPYGDAGRTEVTTAAPRTPRADRPAPPPRVQAWKNALLDLTLRNRLLNLDGPMTSLPLVTPPDALGTLASLLQQGRTVSVRAVDDLAGTIAGEGRKDAYALPATCCAACSRSARRRTAASRETTTERRCSGCGSARGPSCRRPAPTRSTSPSVGSTGGSATASCARRCCCSWSRSRVSSSRCGSRPTSPAVSRSTLPAGEAAAGVRLHRRGAARGRRAADPAGHRRGRRSTPWCAGCARPSRPRTCRSGSRRTRCSASSRSPATCCGATWTSTGRASSSGRWSGTSR